MEKVENDAAAFARTLAENRGRNVALSERVVRESTNLTEREALDQRLVDLIASDLDDLLRQIDGREVRRFDGRTAMLRTQGVAVVRMEMTARERLLATIANPGLAFVLLSLGMVGFWVEFSHPGLILPGVVGAVALLLFGFSTQILPINWVKLLLVVLAVVLFLLEIKITSYGALTAGGIACLILGGLMLYETPDIPELRVPLGLLVAVSFAVGGITVGLLTLVLRAHRRAVTTGAEGLIGEIAVVIEDCAPDGRVFVHGEGWNAVADPPLRRGEGARVVRLDGLRLRIERAPDGASAPSGVAERGRGW
jgi:membrane-bound serine protease (ClpP class)